MTNVYGTVLNHAKVFSDSDYKSTLVESKVPMMTPKEFFWKPSENKLITVNVDGGFQKKTKVGGVGMVARDGCGRVRYWSASKFINMKLSEVESRTANMGLSLAKKLPGEVELRGDSESHSIKHKYVFEERGSNIIANFLAEFAILQGSKSSKTHPLQMPKGMQALLEEERMGISLRCVFDRTLANDVWMYGLSDFCCEELKFMKSVVGEAVDTLCSVGGDGRKKLTMLIVSGGLKFLEVNGICRSCYI